MTRRLNDDAQTVLDAHGEGADHPRHGLLGHVDGQVDATVRPTTHDARDVPSTQQQAQARDNGITTYDVMTYMYFTSRDYEVMTFLKSREYDVMTNLTSRDYEVMTYLTLCEYDVITYLTSRYYDMMTYLT